MAISAAALNTALDAQDTGKKCRAIKHVSLNTASTDLFYVVGGVGASKKARWCQTTRAGNAAAQATEVLALMV